MVDMHGYFILFLISLISILIIRSLFSSSRTKFRLPPGPFSLPIIGHLHLLTPIPHQALHKLSTRYGPLFRFSLGSVPCVAVSSPEMAKEFLRTYEGSYLDRPTNSTTHYLTYGSKDFVFAQYGPYWKLMKKLVMSELLNGKTLDLLQPVRKNEVNMFFNMLSQRANLGKPVDISDELFKLTNNLVSRMIMSVRCSEEENEASKMRNLVTEMTKLTGEFDLSVYISFLKNIDLQGYRKRLRDIHPKYDDLIERIISEHEEERRKKNGKHEARDILDILLDILEDDTMEMKLTKDNIKAFILNLFTAGTDTTSATIEWGLAELINHPRIMKKVVEEIDRVVGKTRRVDESDIPNLPYLQAVVKETLRLHPAVPMIPRMATEDRTIGGYHVPAKTSVYLNIYAINRHPDSWNDPESFIPERFEQNPVDIRGQHYQILSFGSGRRTCPGTSLAMLMMPVALGGMVQCFNWKAGENGDMDRVDMAEEGGLTLTRATPLVCIPVPRLDSTKF